MTSLLTCLQCRLNGRYTLLFRAARIIPIPPPPLDPPAEKVKEGKIRREAETRGRVLGGLIEEVPSPFRLMLYSQVA